MLIYHTDNWAHVESPVSLESLGQNFWHCYLLMLFMPSTSAIVLTWSKYLYFINYDVVLFCLLYLDEGSSKREAKCYWIYTLKSIFNFSLVLVILKLFKTFGVEESGREVSVSNHVEQFLRASHFTTRQLLEVCPELWTNLRKTLCTKRNCVIFVWWANKGKMSDHILLRAQRMNKKEVMPYPL